MHCIAVVHFTNMVILVAEMQISSSLAFMTGMTCTTHYAVQLRH
jgi:hypothetical protein